MLGRWLLRISKMTQDNILFPFDFLPAVMDSLITCNFSIALRPPFCIVHIWISVLSNYMTLLLPLIKNGHLHL
jgi:hypothetical protein